MTPTATKAASQALTLAKPASAPVAVKADRAPQAQDRSAGFAEVLAEEKSGERVEEGRASKDTPVTRSEAGAVRTKPGGEDRSATGAQPEIRPGDDRPEVEVCEEHAAKPAETEKLPNISERSKPEGNEVNQPVAVGTELAPVVVPQERTVQLTRDSESGGSDAEVVDIADSKLSSEESSGAGRDQQAASIAAPNATKRPAPAGARAASNGTPQAQSTASDTQTVKSDDTAAPSQEGSAAADDDAAGVRADTPARPLTIRELNEMLVRIDPQWAAKGLALPASVIVAKSSARASSDDQWSVGSASAPFQMTPAETGQVKPAQGFNADDTRAASSSSVQTSQLPNQGESPQARADERVPATDPRGHGADAAKPAVGNAERSTATPSAPGTTGVVQFVDRAAGGDKASPVAPVHERGVLSIDSARPGAKTTAANPATNPAPQTPAFAAQVQRGLAAAIAQGGGQVTLRLNPEALGQLRVKLDLRADVVKLRFEVGSSAARSLLDEQLPGLGRMLEAQGLRVAHSSVGTDSSLAPTHNPTPPQDANGMGAQNFADGGGQWAGTSADGGAQRQASEHAAGRIEPAEAGESPRSGEVHIEREGGVLDPVTLRLNAIA